MKAAVKLLNKREKYNKENGKKMYKAKHNDAGKTTNIKTYGKPLDSD